MHLGTKSNIQEESNALEGIKGNDRIKWKEQLNKKDDQTVIEMLTCFCLLSDGFFQIMCIAGLGM